jgi:hypothetical protein
MAQQIAVTSRALPVYPNGIQDALTVQNTGSNPVYLDQGPTVSTNSLVVNAGGTQTWPGGTALWMVSPLGTTVTVTDGAGATFDPLAIATAIEQFLTPDAIAQAQLALTQPQARQVFSFINNGSAVIPPTVGKSIRLWAIVAFVSAPTAAGSSTLLTIKDTSSGTDLFPEIIVFNGNAPVTLPVQYGGYQLPVSHGVTIAATYTGGSGNTVTGIILYSLV